MQFVDIDPVARHAAELQRIKAELQRIESEIDSTEHLWLVASALTRLSADLQEAVARHEWRQGFDRAMRLFASPRIGSGVVVTESEVQ